jgi:hypothetical protein
MVSLHVLASAFVMPGHSDIKERPLKDIAKDYPSTLASARPGTVKRLLVMGELLAGLRRHDFRAARTFNTARHVVCLILGLEQPDYYPEQYFSPKRFLSKAQPS